MFERFRRSRGTNASEGSVATREHDAATAPETTRFERQSPGERDRGVVAGGGDADLDAGRRFEHDEMAQGDTAATEPALDRDHARDDLARDDVAPREDPVAREG